MAGAVAGDADLARIGALLAPPSSVGSLRAAISGQQLRRARLCYDHLAGTVAVTVSGALLRLGYLVERPSGYGVTPAGVAAFGTRGIDVAALERRRRPLARRCMDWSERREHLAGSLGAALLARLLELRWVRPREASRVVTVTAGGRAGLRDWLGVDITEGESP